MMFFYLFKFVRKCWNTINYWFYQLLCFILLKGNKVKFNNFRTFGLPYIMVARGGKCTIGKNFAMINEPCKQRCVIIVDTNAELIIGDNVGLSDTLINVTHQIKIGSHVKVGRGSCVYDSDFHSLDPQKRKTDSDTEERNSVPTIIHDNVFIGARTLILKGVCIGENSVVGAGSVVTKSIPPNQIWAGNPAKFIKEINL